MIPVPSKVLDLVAQPNPQGGGTARPRVLKSGISRTLALGRYIQLKAPEESKERQTENRRLSAEAIALGEVLSRKLPVWQGFVRALAGDGGENSQRLLFARQNSRLMVGMAGGVLENGGLTLDRVSGVPCIPGSAVKGCARRAVLAALQEWASGELKPGDPANPLSVLVEGFSTPGELLAAVCRVFGWGPEDWEHTSDLAWACGHQWQDLRQEVAGRFCEEFGREPDEGGTLWKMLPGARGAVCFLPAYPWEQDPGIGLDVITCHHRAYYDEEKAVADDTESPVPVVFPAILPGKDWVFALYPALPEWESQILLARKWLAAGLEIFGIGAKTRSGYGWFQVVTAPGQKPVSAVTAFAGPVRESDSFLSRWGKKQINSFSIKPFIQQVSGIQSAGELLRIFEVLAPDKVRNLNLRDPFWNPFHLDSNGKKIVERLREAKGNP
jgi:CRISPR-associated protein Cmr6